MSSSPELHSTEKARPETRKVLGPGGNRVIRYTHTVEQQKRNKKVLVGLKKPAESPKQVMDVMSNNGSVDNATSDSSSSTVKRTRVKKPAKVVPDQEVDDLTLSSSMEEVLVPLKRCHWITPSAEPLYISFHDDEWGNPVYDDTKLYELLALSQALAEMTWPAILNKRHIFRKVFDNFDPSSLANINDKRFRSLTESGKPVLSEPKIRAIIENAKHFLKIQQEFGSFSNYCWRFVNHKPIKSGFRYTRQVPAKTAKSELMSKDLMKRGFLCVGPTVVYSFMQVSGIVNDHLITCFRYNECNNNNNVKENTQQKLVKTDIQGDPADNTDIES